MRNITVKMKTDTKQQMIYHYKEFQRHLAEMQKLGPFIEFGKHRYTPVCCMEDLGYLRWFYEKSKFKYKWEEWFISSEKHLKAAEERINEISDVEPLDFGEILNNEDYKVKKKYEMILFYMRDLYSSRHTPEEIARIYKSAEKSIIQFFNTYPKKARFEGYRKGVYDLIAFKKLPKIYEIYNTTPSLAFQLWIGQNTNINK